MQPKMEDAVDPLWPPHPAALALTPMARCMAVLDGTLPPC